MGVLEYTVHGPPGVCSGCCDVSVDDDCCVVQVGGAQMHLAGVHQDGGRDPAGR